MTHSHHSSCASNNEKQLFFAMILTGTFVFVEILGGIYSQSLALFSDALHMATDFFSLFFAWLAFKIGRKPADEKKNFGYHRFEIIAAFLNGISLIAIVLWILYKAVERIITPVAIQGEIMGSIAIIGFFVNIGCFFILHKADKNNLNIKGALIHVVGDLLSSTAAVIASVVITLTGWLEVDAFLSILVAVFIFRSAWYIFKNALHILLEGAPLHIDQKKIKDNIFKISSSIENIHNIQIWQLTSEHIIAIMHIKMQIVDKNEENKILIHIKKALYDLGVTRSTIQIETTQTCIDNNISI